jgi:hypothetical protein
VFRPRYRRPPFADPLNWTDFRWDSDPWHKAAAAPRGFGHRRRRHPLVLLLIAGVAALVGAKLLSELQSRNVSWGRRALYGVVLLMIFGAFSKHWRRGGW